MIKVKKQTNQSQVLLILSTRYSTFDWIEAFIKSYSSGSKYLPDWVLGLYAEASERPAFTAHMFGRQI